MKGRMYYSERKHYEVVKSGEVCLECGAIRASARSSVDDPAALVDAALRRKAG